MKNLCSLRVVSVSARDLRGSLKDEAATRSIASEKGATMLETAMVLPLFLLFVVGMFDVSSVMRQQFAVAESLRVTAKFISSRTSSCRSMAELQFNQAMESSGTAAKEARLNQITREVVSDVPGFRVNASAEYNCLFCFRSIGILPPQTLSLFVPEESPASCPDV